MTVRIEDSRICLEGTCPVEEAETLLQALEEGEPLVDLSAAGRLHTAVVQVLLAAHAAVVGEPPEPFVRRYLMPLFSANVVPPGDSG